MNRTFKRTTFEMEIFCNNVEVIVFTSSFDQFNVSLLNEIHFF